MNSNPVMNISNFSKFSKKVFEEFNFARSNPKLYARKLVEIKNRMKDNIININGFGIYYSEGTAAFEEAIDFLRSLPSPSKLSLCLTQGIINSTNELLNLLILHEGIEGISDNESRKFDLDKRINHYGASFGELDELIDYGTFDPEFVIVNFIVCDGDPERKDRQILFNPLTKYCGVTSGILPSEKICTVINLAEYFFNPGEIVSQAILQKFTNMNLNQIGHNNQNSDEIKTRKRNQSTKMYKEKQEKFQNKKGVINLEPSKTQVNEKEEKKDLRFSEKSNKNENIETNLKESIIKNNKSVTEKTQTKFIEDNDLSLPENVDRINLFEKTVKDKTTGKDVVIIKKVVFYNDGNQDVTIYRK